MFLLFLKLCFSYRPVKRNIKLVLISLKYWLLSVFAN